VPAPTRAEATAMISMLAKIFLSIIVTLRLKERR
jgi:hypothetical protein